ncbi:MAG TPA: TIGR02266 family protein [Polyangia bacterium]
MRTPITLKIKFKSSNLDQFIERYSVDVSRGGIFIRTKEPLPVGTQLRFEFQLQDASSLIAGDGTVVWIREHDPARQGVAPGMGVRFDKLAADSQKVLDRILSEKQKRGDAQLESRFDAGVRASASASGTLSSSGRVAGHNDFSGGDSRTATPLPGAIPGLAAPDDEFGNESTRVMQNELVQSLADKTRGQNEDAANAFSEPEPTRKASVEELKLAVQGSAVEKATEPAPKKEEAKVEVAPEPKVEAKAEAKKEEPKPVVVEAKTEEPAKEAPKPAAVVEAKKEEKKPEPVARDAKHKGKGKNRGAQDEARAEAKNGEVKKADDKSVKPADKKGDRAATAAPHLAADEPPRKRSSAGLLYAGVAVVALVGGYTVFRNKGGDEDQKPAEQQQAAAQPQPEQPKPVAQNETPKPTESPTAAEAKGDKPEAAPTPAETPNPAKPDKEPTAALEKKPAGLSVPITSDPAGATVTLDGKPVDGATPTTLSALDGKKVYDLKLSMKGFHDWKVKLKPKAGDKIDAALVPNEKIVEVATTPPGADVMLDGKRVGKTPFTIHKLDLTKAHALEVKRSGFVSQSRSISATDTFEPKGDKDVLALAMTLEAAPRSAERSATPAVAKSSKAARKPPAVKKPTEEKPAEAATEKAAATDKAPAEKPAAADKPAAAEKPAATDKPAAGDKAGIKVPSWMKQKPAEGGDKASAPAADPPAP